MSDTAKPIAFSQLLSQCHRIEVPLIQRDYAQGRDSAKDVRDDFLKSIHAALSLPVGSPQLPLNLDFIYGSMEGQGDKVFLPLDGQQRLTTLFLLHWYLAWKDNALEELRTRLWDGRHARFTYSVRPSTTEFFDQVVSYCPASGPESIESIRRHLQDQPWFFLHWRLDPTIQSVLTMLDAIHERFSGSTGLYVRLIDHEQPAITFHLLPLEHFGLTDDLYIKMNARGKPLTAFETFKARFEDLLKELFPTEKRTIGDEDLSFAAFFERRIDTQWTDFFWNYKNPATNTFDDALMNLIWVLIRLSLDPSNPTFADDISSLRSKWLTSSYTIFHDRGWLTREFAQHLISLLETWSSGQDQLAKQLPNSHYFDEMAFFKDAIKDPAGIEYTNDAIFTGFVYYIRQNEGSIEAASFSEWMRVVFNLAQNTNIERPEDYGRSLTGLRKLLPVDNLILQRLATMELEPLGFSPQQIAEEALKARLILSHEGWRSRILAAEEHGYFRGQIGFLFDFADISTQAAKAQLKQWDEGTHIRLQATFDEYARKALLMFEPSGVAPLKSELWKRALLTVGNYLLPLGRNYSFLTNPPKSGDSWKRFLRDQTEQRQFLKSLWDKLDANQAVEPQLLRIINAASGLEPWRSAIVKNPAVIAYCGEQEIRWEQGSNEIYLLKKRQMNGAHAELFSYVLHHELTSEKSRKALEPLTLHAYMSVTMTENEPYIWLSLSHTVGRVSFIVFSSNSQFVIQVDRAELAKLPEVTTALCNKFGFRETPGHLSRFARREEIHQILRDLASTIATLTNSAPQTSSHKS